ncbi:MAG: 3'-5' exonuclease, partial [Bacteroidetes bacterium]|nr:3'-5' exonuclease [Bacteroidota bacterium]
MLEKYNPENILFLDIETVPQYPSHSGLPDPFVPLWEKKAGQLSKYDKFSNEDISDPAVIYERAGIYAEFGKIVCIST